MDKKKRITAHPDSFAEYMVKLWQYRALIVTFARRDIKVKYAQTWLGLGWTIVQPLTGMVLYTFFFGYLMQLQASGLPYLLYVASGILAWNFFNYIVYQGTASIQESTHVIKKIYFPKAVLPLSKVLVGLFELSVNMFLLALLMIWFGMFPAYRLLFFPLAVLFVALCGFTLVIWIAVLAYRLRDLFHLVPYLVYFGIWVTPVFFTKELIPERLRPLMWMNPMAAGVEFWRWTLFAEYSFSFVLLAVIFPVLLLLCILGLLLYARKESRFSDFV